MCECIVRARRISLIQRFAAAFGLLASLAAAAGATLTALPDFSETWNSQVLYWEKASFTDLNPAGSSTASIPFGLALPAGYTNGAGSQYPLILYLHGAGARGNNNNSNLSRQTARFFAHQARTVSRFNAFVLSPQVPTGQRFVEVDWDFGTYVQSAATYATPMHLTEHLVHFLIEPTNHALLTAVLHIAPAEIDTDRIYVIGDSMGAYGAWDTVGRGAVRYAAAIAACGSGPSNRIEQILATPFWAIHGAVDATVPNFLPRAGDVDGAGSLGMLQLIDPAFDNHGSTGIIRLDQYATAADDPSPSDMLIYSEYPSSFDHATVATGWTTSMASDFSTWLFAQSNAPTPPRLALEQNTAGTGWEIRWPDGGWVLQQSGDPGREWADIEPLAASPYPLVPALQAQFFRLRGSGSR